MKLSNRQILDDLVGTVCRACDGAKNGRMSHCRSCYYKLPTKMRMALYKKFGDGYEEAYIESCDYLETLANGVKP